MVVKRPVNSVIVIGGGTSGTSIAYNLASRGIKVRLIESGNIASGNTGKSSALVRTHYSNEFISSLALYSIREFMNFGDIGYSGFTKTGMVFPFGEDNAGTAKENFKMLKNLGIDEREISIKDVVEFFPDINTSDYDYILYEPDSGYADPVATANAYASAAKNMGAEIMTGKTVKTVESADGKTSVETDKGEKFYADAIVMATNVWTNKLLQKSGISDTDLLPIYASIHDVIYLRRPDKYTGIKPTLWDPQNSSYYKMEGASLTAIGSLDPEKDTAKFDMDSNIENHATDEYVEEYLGKLIDRLPGMDDASVISTVSGLYDMTPDGQAIIDSLSSIGLDNVYVCAGLSGHGFKLSPAYGRIVADMLALQEPEKALFDWRTFSSDRFKNKKPIQSLYSGIGTIY